MLKGRWDGIESPLVQYLIGSFINILCLVILISNETSYQNLQLPEGIYADNLWKGTDVITYVNPARNFVGFLVFGSETVPDYHRTIGYPLFISGLMILFSDNWLLPALFIQAMIFATIYPALNKISKFLFENQLETSIYSFIFFIISGTYIAMTPVIMTDLFFSVFFTVGLYFGFESVIRRSFMYLLFHILFIGYAAQVRPVLVVYPLINLIILLWLLNKHKISMDMRIYTIISVATIGLAVLCNMPSIRNYANHRFFSPTDILYNNLFDYLAHDVLTNSGEVDKYSKLRDDVHELTNVRERTKEQKVMAINVFKEYPLLTLAQISKNAVGIMIRSHWSIIANFWGYNFEDNLDRPMPLRKSNFVFILEGLFNFIYLLVYILFLAFLARNLRSTNFKLSLVMVILISYLMIPTFMVSGAGSRFRLPVEGVIVLASMSELTYRIKLYNIVPYSLIKRYLLSTKR